MSSFSTKRLPLARDSVAPDQSDVRILLGLAGGGMAHFELAPGTTSVAVGGRLRKSGTSWQAAERCGASPRSWKPVVAWAISRLAQRLNVAGRRR